VPTGRIDLIERILVTRNRPASHRAEGRNLGRKELGHAEEEVWRGTNRDAASPD